MGDNDKYQEYLIAKAEYGSSDFVSYKEWLDPEQAERERREAIEARYNMMMNDDTWDLY